MCSIAGIINHADRDEAAGIIADMNRRQRHRGPDDAGFWQSEHAALGHRRLSIIDPTQGRQPMGSPDASVQLVFNGEIYNFRELRRELEARNHRFQTNSDTEVIIHLYREYGSDGIDRLHGMFAFGLWDEKKQRLLLVRDRLGQKPLLYFQLGRELVFASEMAALKAHPRFPAEIDPVAVSDYLSLQYVPPGSSIYRQVRKLPPGHYLEFDAVGGLSCSRCYWRPDYGRKDTRITFEDATRQTRLLVEKAVEKRLMAEVPSGAFLSGGLDSAVITALMARLRLPERTPAFTITFDQAAYNEQAEAELSAGFIDRITGGALDHHQRLVCPDNFDLLPKLIRHYGEPFADASMLPTFMLAEFARERVTMALSGDGADEVFAGYERYLVMKYAAAARLPGQGFASLAALLPERGERTRIGRLRRLLKVFSMPDKRRYFGILDRCPPALKFRLFGERLREAARHDSITALELERYTAADAVERCLENDLHRYLPGDILPKLDIASMAVSLEVRNPFLDHELIEFAASLPLRFKQCGRSRKHILKAAFADLVAPEILNGRKRGFGVPVGEWLCGKWQPPVREALLGGRLLADGWIDKRMLEQLWSQHCTRRCDNTYLLFNLVMLGLFLEQDQLPVRV